MPERPKAPLARTSPAADAASTANAASTASSGSAANAAAPGDTAAAKKGEDVALVFGRAPNGGLNILRKRENQLEAGVVQPLREGVPVHGEVIQLHPRGESPLCDVEVHVPGPTRPMQTDIPRPAQVATDSYRKNWDQIYKRRESSKLLN